MTQSASTVANPAAGVESKSSEVESLLAKAAKLLDDSDTKQAMALLSRSRLSSPWINNALGVCQLRNGDVQAALTRFRGMAVSDTLLVRTDVPSVFKTNYATALLASKNIAGCLTILSELRSESHPAIAKLQAAIERWKSNLSVWQRIQWHTGSELDVPVACDFPLGDLE